MTERLSAWKEEQKTEKQPSQQDDKQAEVESVQEVESGVQEPAEMLMEVEVSGEEPVDDQDVQETGAWDSEGGFIFDPFTREDQSNVASMVNRKACSERGIDPSHMDKEEMIAQLCGYERGGEDGATAIIIPLWKPKITLRFTSDFEPGEPEPSGYNLHKIPGEPA
ncbi:hypothetical protein Bbelb_317030 [Branchiostoma belcheri]|nr:hypothetical protein Bbelb_317030 [Branchiostoma belcheri]